jgi:hypothetical protein
MRPPVKFVCQSSFCRREVEISPDEGPERIRSPRCACGAEMKRVYLKPVFRELPNEASLQLGDNVLLQKAAKCPN